MIIRKRSICGAVHLQIQEYIAKIFREVALPARAVTLPKQGPHVVEFPFIGSLHPRFRSAEG